MKSRASLVLMEQLVMILVFALCAALCLGLFARADALSRETELQDRAVVLAQSVADAVKACRGDLDEAARIAGGEDAGDLILDLVPLPQRIPGLGEASVAVFDAQTGQLLVCLNAAWQEVE